MAETEELICVAPRYVDTLWPRVALFINDALIRSHSDYTLGHVYNKLKNRESLLWVAWNGKKFIAAMTTEICSVLNTDRRVCVITAFSSQSRHLHQRFLKDIEQYAHDEHCELIRLYGREGWIRALRDYGYKQPWIALEKRLA